VVGTRDLKNGSDSFLFSKSIKDQARTDKTDYNCHFGAINIIKYDILGLFYKLLRFSIFVENQPTAHHSEDRPQRTNSTKITDLNLL
jgi:hypothetical protein